MIKKNKTFIIAEAGVNHDGSLKKAFKLVKGAKLAGADAVKFQIWKTENVITKKAPLAKYQKTKKKNSLYQLLKKLELPYSSFKKIKNYCMKEKIIFMATADEIESAKYVVPLVKIIKVGSAELTDIPYLEKIGKFKKKTIISTGMGNIKEINQAIKALKRGGLKKKLIYLLHCNTAYPTPLKDVNLNVIKQMIKKYGENIGFSDHSAIIETPVAAVAIGAKIVEKHITINKNSDGPDHSSSLNVKEFKRMVKSIRNIELALGSKIKKVTQSEKENVLIVRKSVYAKKKINKGEKFSEKNLIIKRPGYGLAPDKLKNIIGTKSKKIFKIDDLINV